MLRLRDFIFYRNGSDGCHPSPLWSICNIFDNGFLMSRFFLALVILFGMAASAVAQPISSGTATSIAPGTNGSSLNVTATGGTTNSLATWMSYLNGTSNPNPVVFGDGLTVNGAPLTLGSITTLGLGNINGVVNFSGTYNASSGGNPGNFLVCNNAAMTLSPASAFADCTTIQYTFGGSNVTGGQEGLAVYMTQTAPTSTSNTNRNYAPLIGVMIANSPDQAVTTATVTAPSAAAGTTSLTVSSISGFNANDIVEIQMDIGRPMVTTVSGTPSGSTIVVTGTFPDQATSGNAVYNDTTSTATKLTATVAQDTTVTNLTVNSITGLTNGVGINLTMDGNYIYSTYVFGTPSGTTLPIRGALPFQVSANNTMVNRTISGPKGAYFSIGNNTTLANGVVNTLEATGSEFNVQLKAGSSTQAKSGISIAGGAQDRVQGTVVDCAICVGQISPVVGWRNGLLFTPINGANPMDPRGTLIATSGSAAADIGIDFSSYAFGTDLIKGPNSFEIKANGSIRSLAVTRTGSVPTATGTCAVKTQTGGNTAGTFTANGACSGGTVILTFAVSSVNGWQCLTTNQTTPTNLMNVTSSTTTSCTMTGTMANNDVVVFSAHGY